MARFGVTYQDVANAAEQILGQGRQPTIEAIRHLLGTGSTTTIANHLRQWRSEQDEGIAVAAREDVPQEFVAMLKGLWQRVLVHADGQIEEAKLSTEMTIQSLQVEVEKYKGNNQRWQKLHDALMKDKERRVREKLTLEQTIMSIQNENAGLVAHLEAANKQSMEKQARIEELHRLHQLGQANLEHERENSRVQRLIDQKNHDQQMQQVEATLAKANQTQLILQHQIDEQRHAHAILAKTHDEIKGKFEQLQTDSQHTSLNWRNQVDVLQSKLNHQDLTLGNQQSQLTAAHREIIALKERNTLLENDKWEIIQQKAQLEGVITQMEKTIYSKEIETV